VEVIRGDFERKGGGGGSTGCGRVLLEDKAFGREGILWTLLSVSGSDSVPLEDVSGSAEATGQAGIINYYQTVPTTEILTL